MNVYSLFDEETGLLTGKTIACTESLLAANTPSGMVAVEGIHDHLSKRVDLATFEVVDYQPPSPGDDAMQTWAWDTTTKRWLTTKTTKAIAKDMRDERNARLDASDKLVMPFIGDEKPVPPTIKAYRQALRDVPDQAGFPLSVVWPAPPDAPA